jgi:hypothetical protein
MGGEDVSGQITEKGAALGVGRRKDDSGQVTVDREER